MGGAGGVQQCRRLCTELKAFFSSYHFPDHAAFNFDETRVVHRAGKVSLLRVEPANEERANVRSSRHCTVASLPTFISADEGVLLSVFILKGSLSGGEARA